MIALVATIAWAGVHLVAYMFVLRHRHAFRRSTTILSYHAWFAATTGLLLAGLTWAGSDPTVAVPAAVAAVAFCGIYSVSFLELWALADGGYSIAILRSLLRDGGQAEHVIVREFSRLGVEKQEERLTSLAALGLVARVDNSLVMTHRGRYVAKVATTILRICNVRQRG